MMSGGERPSKAFGQDRSLPPGRLQHQTVDVQQRQILLPARAHGRTPHPGQEDRLKPGSATGSPAARARGRCRGPAEWRDEHFVRQSRSRGSWLSASPPGSRRARSGCRRDG